MEQRKNAPLEQDLPPGLLDFTPVPLRTRIDGWTRERQRAYVAALALSGSGRLAAACVGLTEQTAARLRRRPDGASFRRACELAWQVGKTARRQAASGDKIHSHGKSKLPQFMNLPAPIERE